MPIISTIFAVVMFLFGLGLVWVGGLLAFGGATMVYMLFKG